MNVVEDETRAEYLLEDLGKQKTGTDRTDPVSAAMTSNPSLPPLSADGRTVQVGDQVVIIFIPRWLIHDLPAEDQASLKAFEGKTLPIHEIDEFGYVWFSTQLCDFCLRPEEVRLA